jgi:hypothetical protein
MMAKFIVVDTEPTTLRKGEHVIKFPDFLEEIKANSGKAPRGGITATNHLRNIVGTIGQKYDENLTSWSINPFNFEGRTFNTDQDLSEIVIELLKKQHPTIFQSYVDAKIKARPDGTKVIYFVGPFNYTTAFYTNGLDLIEPKDVEVELGLKPKKVVGKPAVTKEEAEELKNKE